MLQLFDALNKVLAVPVQVKLVVGTAKASVPFIRTTPHPRRIILFTLWFGF
jgi:hypothetical protein